jgi:hypothetical protein
MRTLFTSWLRLCATIDRNVRNAGGLWSQSLSECSDTSCRSCRLIALVDNNAPFCFGESGEYRRQTERCYCEADCIRSYILHVSRSYSRSMTFVRRESVRGMDPDSNCGSGEFAWFISRSSQVKQQLRRGTLEYLVLGKSGVTVNERLRNDDHSRILSSSSGNVE